MAGHAAGLLLDRGMPGGYPARKGRLSRGRLGIAYVIGIHGEDLLPRGRTRRREHHGCRLCPPVAGAVRRHWCAGSYLPVCRE